ncbi:MAG: hypothetical protein KYX62_06300 [Pseudomonadota bacterium]|nr:hypothetical protein [Pseudomonadota bacterium]
MTLKLPVVLTIVLLLSACDSEGTPILRGKKAAQPAATATVPAVVAATDDQQPAEPQDMAAEEKRTLNLTLPDLGWEGPAGTYDAADLPDVFRSSTAPEKYNWSGRLHLDESEEARERPITDNIRGAEIEFQVRLP